MAKPSDSAVDASRRDEFHSRGREILELQTRALDALIHDLHLLDPKKTITEIRTPLLMLQAVGVSVHSVLALTVNRDMAIRDVFGIARSITETAINAAYISVGGEEIAAQAHRHMRQKRWRDLNRKGKIGSWQIEASREVGISEGDIPGLSSDLAEFTNKRGREIRDWTPVGVEGRITEIGATSRPASLSLGVALFAIYRVSSEFLHGTFYGVTQFWQGSRSDPALSRDAFDDLWLSDHFITILTAVFFAVHGAATAISEVHQFPAHQQSQSQLAQRLRALIEDMGGPEPEPDHTFSMHRPG